MPSFKTFRAPVILAATALLAGCNMVVLNPSGDVASQQGRLVMIATGLMLLIIIPVIVLTLLFAWRYRAANKDADYQPDWHHSTRLELVIWSAPLLIIIALGALTWISTHTLDPYRPLDRVAAGKPVAADVKPLEIQVVSLDWKWLFIYPEQGIATVNEVAAPVDRPIRFKLTSSTTMNAFYVPDLAGMIYTMPGMQTELNAVINKPGVYHGLSSHYSGAGFSGMTFKFHGVSDQDFAKWVADAKSGSQSLTRAVYNDLARPSERNPVRRFASVDADLYSRVLGLCTVDGQRCMHEVMAQDALRGRTKAGEAAVAALMPQQICTPNQPVDLLN
ncbi:ubiquinol oxidase subunit II [Pseudacidovorax sp. RU35E]|uniref:ubiquinol oxidase subunit II n=1 Tax=Pseudacidovorax sp. RU35E TaxID=1907403 RepID=UPI000953F3C8|nr:ubiquinol oxidase subunit II [Pseudacidovorax sp. RU35E]SIR30591.1 cytochrome bo3 quinol oxidase subunit 2 [Pseudacidovorax sp. RU35E]